MKKIVFFTIISFLLSIPLSAQNLNRVYDRMAKEDWGGALAKLDPLLNKKKENSKVYEAKWLAAICHMHEYRFDQAFDLFDQSAPFAEIDPFYYVPYAQAYLLSGDPVQAEEVIKRGNISDIDQPFKKDYAKVLDQIRAAQLYLADPEEVVVQNLGEKINSNGSEYSQVIMDDFRGIVYAARRDNDQALNDSESYDQIMKAEMNDLDQWVFEEEVRGYNNNEDYIAPVQLMDQDNTLIYFKNNDLFIGTKTEDGAYVGEEAFPFNSKGFDSHANMFNNNNSIIFASDQKNSQGNADLYIAHKNADGTWSSPKNLKELNTEYNEDAPFVAADGTLYFSSQGHDAMGGYDIFKTRFDSAAGEFTAPINLGAPINMPGDDSFFTIQGKFGYFSSNRPNGYGNSDIYKVLMFSKSQLQGRLFDCDMNLLPNAELTITNLVSGEVFHTQSNEYGVYQMITPVEQPVQVKVTFEGQTVYDEKHHVKILFREKNNIGHDFRIGECADGGKEIYLTMINSYDLDPMNLIEDFSNASELIAAVKRDSMALVKEEAKEAIVANFEFPVVNFDFDDVTIKGEFATELDALAVTLKEYTDLKVTVAGHTDAIGDVAYNEALGLRRANAVVDYLVNRGVNIEQLEGTTFSEDRPIASNETKSGRATNRRVELYFNSENGTSTVTPIKENNVPVINFPVVNFDFDQSEIKSEYSGSLDDLAEQLTQYRDLKVSVTGHTDDIGARDYNAALGLRRASAVVQYLVSKGVDADQFVEASFSEDKPIASNETAKGRASNRRVELTIIR